MAERACECCGQWMTEDSQYCEDCGPDEDEEDELDEEEEEGGVISQVELVGKILKLFPAKARINQEQMNAVIGAADAIMAAMKGE